MRMSEEQLLASALAAVRKSLPLNCWSQFADAIVADRRKRQGHLAKAMPDQSWFSSLDDLKRNGFTKLPTILSAEQIAEARTYLDANPVHKGPHIYSFDGRPRPLGEVRQDFPMAAYRFDQVVRAPHLVDAFNDPRLIDFLEAHFGCVPTLYSLNAWWSFPADKPELLHSQFFHRDIDDWRFATLFLYLTDVDGDSGPHQIIRGSHTLEGTRDLVAMAKVMRRDVTGFSPEDSFVNALGPELTANSERLFKEAITDCTGSAGTMWLVNTMGLHRGLMPKTKPRLIVWARYGLGPSVNSADLEQGPIAKRLIPTSLADTPRNRFVNRLLFDFDRGPADY